jgi:hypothetical protein
MKFRTSCNIHSRIDPIAGSTAADTGFTLYVVTIIEIYSVKPVTPRARLGAWPRTARVPGKRYAWATWTAAGWPGAEAVQFGAIENAVCSTKCFVRRNIYDVIKLR